MIRRKAVNISLYPHEIERLDEIAIAANLARSDLIRKWICEHSPCAKPPNDTNPARPELPVESGEP